MSYYHRARWGAIALGCLCATGAGAILLQDIRHTGSLTVDHGLSLIVLVCTIASGHMATGEVLRLRPVRATALALLFLLGSAWCVLSTAGRQADGAAQSRTAVADANRLLILKGEALDEARKRLAPSPQPRSIVSAGLGSRANAWAGKRRSASASRASMRSSPRWAGSARRASATRSSRRRPRWPRC